MNDRQLLDHYDIVPKKSLGQNFLHDPNALEKIVELAELPPGATVLEIGPGTGNLTRVLAEHAARVVAVELDGRLIDVLRDRLAPYRHVTLVQGDILEVDIAELVGMGPYYVVGNVPYYITSAILRHILERPARPQRVVLTVQREVAERLTAQPGDMSLLAVSVQVYGQPQIAMRLKPGAFWPRPDVESAVVVIDTGGGPAVDVPDETLFFRVVRAGFSQKRKQLRNTLSAGLHIDKARAGELLAQAEIDARRRAETLALDEWAALARAAAQAGL
jgi:16S rRNA (adenine1518-N6/adenine1519-N6)-dimethyltransferase